MKNRRDRMQAILSYLESKPFAKIEELCEQWNVSLATMRRDLQSLHEDGRLIRVNGGAVLTSSEAGAMDSPYPFVISRLEVKERIAAAAISLIQNGDTIFMDGGTTNLVIARRIAQECSNIKIVTNCIDIAYTFNRRKDFSIYICGGTMGNEPGSTVVGPLAEKMISYFRANICFLGTFGIHLKKGITDPSLSSAHMKAIMMENATKAILVTDSSKFGKINTAYVCAVEELDTIITDRDAPNEDIKGLQNKGRHVILV